MPALSSRRQFVKGSLALSSILIVPGHVLGKGDDLPPSERANLAMVGLGNRANALSSMSAGHNLVALCDANQNAAFLPKAKARAPKAPFFDDYRVMLDKMGKDIDGVIVATPNHLHYPIAMACMMAGKNVYVEKPMAITPWELRGMAKASQKYKIVSQMGNQGHSTEALLICKEWIGTGLLGKVNEVHVWSKRTGIAKVPEVKENPVPEGLNWDLWLGPAKERPFSPAWIKWRSWWDFGGGVLYDIGCHTIDAPFYALDLGAPSMIKAEPSNPSSPCPPQASTIEYNFPAKGDRGPVKLFWYDGRRIPPRPKGLEPDRAFDQMAAEGGCYISGEKGSLFMPGMRPESCRLIPESWMQEVAKAKQLPTKSAERQGLEKAGHLANWVKAFKTGGKACSDFAVYAAPLAEIVCLGTIALRSKELIHWDAEHIGIPNNPEAEQLLRPHVRKGWEYEA